MNFFKKKNRKDITEKKENSDRRSFITKSSAVLLGAGLFANTKNVFSAESETGYIYVKQNGDVIRNYKPMDDVSRFIGSLMIVGFNYAPAGWLICNGQLLQIAQYGGLFNLLGTTYGGDGITTFALPNLQSRIVIGQGQGAGLSSYTMGQQDGREEHQLLQNQMPAHNHPINATSVIGALSSPSSNYIARNADGISTFLLNEVKDSTSFDGNGSSTLHPDTLGYTGENQAHSNLQPYTCMNFIIATEGVLPPGV